MTDPIHVKRIQTPIDEMEYTAGDAAGLDPERTDVVGVELTADNKLELTLEGPRAGTE